MLPDAPWRNHVGLTRIAAALGADAGQARYVGGAVRDTLLGIAVADVDLATAHPPDEVVRRLVAAGIKAVPTGIAHGTITAVEDGHPVEVTTLRRDVDTDGRHAIVAYTDDWREDAARRDFTMNALYADPLTGAVFDWFDGLADLAARRVRFIGDPYRRIAEDHLRILRFFRFHARFGDAVDSAGLAACAARANDLMALSRERISAELLKLLVAPGAVAVVALMEAHAILRPVLPEIDAAGAARLRALADAEHAAGIAPHPIRRLAALLPRDPAIGEAIGGRLKLSIAQRRRLIDALDERSAPPREDAYRGGVDAAIDRQLLLGNPGAAAELSRWSPPAMPLTGGALVARGLQKGPDVARTLRAVESRWIAEDFPGAARANVIADEEVAQALRAHRNA